MNIHKRIDFFVFFILNSNIKIIINLIGDNCINIIRNILNILIE